MNISIRKLLVLLAALAIFLIFLLPTHTEVNKNVTAIKYKLGNTYYEDEVKIDINGTIRHAGIFPKSFYGTMEIDGKTMRFSTDDDNSSTLFYVDKNGRGRTYGFMYTSSDFKEVTITPGGFDSIDGDMISFPASGRYEALVIANRTMREFLEMTGTGKLK